MNHDKKWITFYTYILQFEPRCNKSYSTCKMKFKSMIKDIFNSVKRWYHKFIIHKNILLYKIYFDFHYWLHNKDDVLVLHFSFAFLKMKMLIVANLFEMDLNINQICLAWVDIIALTFRFTDYISYNVDVENSDTSLPYIVIIIKNGRHRQKFIHNDNKRM